MTRTIAPRLAVLALAAANLVSAPAFAGTALSPTQVRLDGRTEAQIRADVQSVASRLCREKVGDDALSFDSCVTQAVRATMKKVVARGSYVWSTASADD